MTFFLHELEDVIEEPPVEWAQLHAPHHLLDTLEQEVGEPHDENGYINEKCWCAEKQSAALHVV